MPDRNQIPLTSEAVLWWTVVAFSMDLTSSVVSYGTFPDQRRRYVSLSTVQTSMQEYWTGKLQKPVGIGAAFKLSLETIFRTFIETDWKTQNSRRIPCSAIMVDVGYKESRDIVYELAKSPDFKGILHPCKGMPTSPDRPSIWNPSTKPRQGERRGHHWRQVQMEDGPQTQIDVNTWKTIVAHSLITEPGDPGALTVYATDKVSSHEMWADQMTVETADKLHSQKTDVTMTTWTSPPGADNHFFDCAVMAFAGASKMGATKTGHREAPRVQAKPRRKKSLKELYDQNNSNPGDSP